MRPGGRQCHVVWDPTADIIFYGYVFIIIFIVCKCLCLSVIITFDARCVPAIVGGFAVLRELPFCAMMCVHCFGTLRSFSCAKEQLATAIPSATISKRAWCSLRRLLSQGYGAIVTAFCDDINFDVVVFPFAKNKLHDEIVHQ